MGILKKLPVPSIEELAKNGDIEGLAKALGHRKSDVRRKAAFALASAGEAAIVPLIQALKDKNWRVREAAADGLNLARGTRSVEPLIVALKDENLHVRKAAAAALDEIGDVRAVEPLITALRDEDYTVVAGAYSFFVTRGEPGTEGTLIKALNKHGNASMASCFLRCGNEKLEKAARSWAEWHNYKVESIPTSITFLPDQKMPMDNVEDLFNVFFGETKESKTKPMHSSTKPAPEQRWLMDNAEKLFGAFLGKTKGAERWGAGRSGSE